MSFMSPEDLCNGILRIPVMERTSTVIRACVNACHCRNLFGIQARKFSATTPNGSLAAPRQAPFRFFTSVSSNSNATSHCAVNWSKEREAETVSALDHTTYGQRSVVVRRVPEPPSGPCRPADNSLMYFRAPAPSVRRSVESSETVDHDSWSALRKLSQTKSFDLDDRQIEICRTIVTLMTIENIKTSFFIKKTAHWTAFDHDEKLHTWLNVGRPIFFNQARFDQNVELLEISTQTHESI